MKDLFLIMLIIGFIVNFGFNFYFYKKGQRKRKEIKESLRLMYKAR